MQVITIGLDLAKRVFQVHGVDAAGQVMVRRKLQRSEMAGFFAALPTCLVGIEACATAHHWARLIRAAGHDVRLIPPSYVKLYVRRSKTDAADAEAICEAVGRPNMRFVPVKSADQQAALLHHRARDLLVRQRTMLINALRGHLAEFGIIAPAGRHRVGDLGHHRGSCDVQVGSRTGSLDWAGATTALQRREAEAGAGIQAGRPISSAVADGRRHLCHAPTARQDGRAFGMDKDAPGPATVSAGLACGCQQDGQDRVGGHGAAGGLSETGHGCRRLTKQGCRRATVGGPIREGDVKLMNTRS